MLKIVAGSIEKKKKLTFKGKKLLLCPWWDMKCVLCYKLLERSETVTALYSSRS